MNKESQVIMLPTEDKSILYKLRESLYTGSYTKCSPVDDRVNQHLHFTTDAKTKVGDWCIDEDKVYQVKEGNLFIGERNQNKIIATTDKSLKLDRFMDDGSIVPWDYRIAEIPQSFIKKYCKVGGIEEVLVEYIQTNQRMDEHSFDGKSYSYDLKLKVDSHNTVTIHQIKNSWTREEVIELCRDAYLTGHDDGQSTVSGPIIDDSFSPEEWIKENL